MRRLLRRAFTLSAMASAFLCAAVCVLWVRSYRVDDHIGGTRVVRNADVDVEECRTGLFSGGGRITYSPGTATGYDPADWAQRRVWPPPADRRFGWSVGSFAEFWGERNFEFPLGFGSGHWGPANGPFDVTSVPYWFLALLAALLPLSWIARRRGWPVMGPWLVVELYAVLLLWAVLMLRATGDSFNNLHLGLLVGLVGYLLCRTCWCLVRFLMARAQGGAGLCQVCGYDLRATPDRCPECGAVPETGPPLGQRKRTATLRD